MVGYGLVALLHPSPQIGTKTRTSSVQPLFLLSTSFILLSAGKSDVPNPDTTLPILQLRSVTATNQFASTSFQKIIMRTTSLFLFFLLAGAADAFTSFTKGAAKKSPGAADEAVAIFAKEFPFNRPPPPKANKIGVPIADIDGTPITKVGSTQGKRLTDISEKEVRQNFQAMSKVYGEEQALEMVKILPISLSFNSKNFGPSLNAFAEIFGLEESKAMVGRNVSAVV